MGHIWTSKGLQIKLHKVTTWVAKVVRIIRKLDRKDGKCEQGQRTKCGTKIEMNITMASIIK